MSRPIGGLAPPTEVLLATATTLAVRVKGRPRSPDTGLHRELVIFTEPTMTGSKLAVRLRDAADALELGGHVRDRPDHDSSDE